MLNLSHPLWEREKDRGYIKGPHYIQDDFGAWTCVLEDINSEVQKGFRFFFPFKLDSKRTKDSFISSAVRISNLQVKYNVYSLIRPLHLCWWWQCCSSSPKLWSTRYLDNSCSQHAMKLAMDINGRQRLISKNISEALTFSLAPPTSQIFPQTTLESMTNYPKLMDGFPRNLWTFMVPRERFLKSNCTQSNKPAGTANWWWW